MTHSIHSTRRWRTLIACVLTLAVFALTATPASAQITTPIPPNQLYLPMLENPNGGTLSPCPTTSTATYASVPVEGAPRSAPYPPVVDPDLNLIVRSYLTTDAHLGLIDIGGHTDANAPRLHTLFCAAARPGLHRGLSRL